MSQFNKKKGYQKIVYSPITLFFLLIFFLILLKAVWGVYKKEHISDEYLYSEQKRLSEVVERQKELAKSVDYLKTDKGVEAEIRNKFRMVREGESMAVIINDKTSAAPEVPVTEPRSWWTNMLRLFSVY